MAAWEPTVLPSGGQGHGKMPIAVNRSISSTSVLKCSLCPSGEGWGGKGLLCNMGLMLGFAHYVFITRPHKKQKSSAEKIKKNFFFFYKDRQVRGSDTFSTLWFLRTKINGKKEDSIFMLWKHSL